MRNLRPGGMAKYGLDYDSVASDNPGLVYASISGFGSTGGAHVPGYDLMVQAVSGLMSLTGPADGPPQHGYTTAVMTAVLEALFADPAVERVVVEPDVENAAIHVLNERVGFVAERDVDLGCKRARLSFCTRAGFEAATHAGSHR